MCAVLMPASGLAWFPGLNLSTLIGTNGCTLKGAENTEHVGYSVSGAGDINGDGVDDFAVGAQGHSAGRGISYVVFCKSGPHSFPAPFGVKSLNGTNGFAFKGHPFFSSGFGLSVSAAGDVYSDGSDDLVVGQPWIHS